MRRMKQEVEDIVDRERQAWDKQDVESLLSTFYPDRVWPWPPTNNAHDPKSWVMVLGRFDHQRWRSVYLQFFQQHRLVHNRRETRRIEISEEGDAAFAVVDIDTLWVDTRGMRIAGWAESGDTAFGGPAV